jgi:UDPglucose 6-dehydrogenase
MGARVKAYDPIAMENCKMHYPQLDVEYEQSSINLALGCDAVILVTEWDEFRRLQLADIASVMQGVKVLVDARNIYKQSEAEAVGLVYLGFGR